MNRFIEKYRRFYLINEMFDTIDIIKNFNQGEVRKAFHNINVNSRLMLTGEGSSRIFPAKNIRHHQLINGAGPQIFIEGANQLRDYPLKDTVIIGASNSGKTKEVVGLFSFLSQIGQQNLYAITCNRNTPLEHFALSTVCLENCSEKAVAATKSVIGQALVYESILSGLLNYEFTLTELADKIRLTLEYSIDSVIIDALAKASIVYFVGNNNGVAEELTLKTNEILRKRAAYLPGTYLLHGIEEVVNKDDVIILVDPIESELEKIYEIYIDKIGATVVAFSEKRTPFLEINLPSRDVYQDGYIKLATGWNLLAEAGIKMNINLDKPERARKIGNEFISITN